MLEDSDKREIISIVKFIIENNCVDNMGTPVKINKIPDVLLNTKYKHYDLNKIYELL
jgi:hypothetical protein